MGIGNIGQRVHPGVSRASYSDEGTPNRQVDLQQDVAAGIAGSCQARGILGRPVASEQPALIERNQRYAATHPRRTTVLLTSISADSGGNGASPGPPTDDSGVYRQPYLSTESGSTARVRARDYSRIRPLSCDCPHAQRNRERTGSIASGLEPSQHSVPWLCS